MCWVPLALLVDVRVFFYASQCCVWKQLSSVISSGVIILKHIFCVSGLSFGISDGMVSLGSIPLGEGFGSLRIVAPAGGFLLACPFDLCLLACHV